MHRKIGKTEGYSPSYDNSTRCAYIRTAGGSFYELWLTKRPFYIITAMLYLCDAVHPSNKLREDISQLIDGYAHLPVQRMGFFDGWNQEPIWAIGKG